MSALVSFATKRLQVRGRAALRSTPKGRRILEAALADMFTPAVLAPLPDALALAKGTGAIAIWIAARDAESAVHTVTRKADGKIIGLLILAGGVEPGTAPAIHLGYLFAETSWGKGFASELVVGLTAVFETGPPLRLLAGVNTSDPASARVLEKAGFGRDGIRTGSVAFAKTVGGGAS